MRDLAARLRAIVQTDGGARPDASSHPAREFTYVPDLGIDGSLAPADVAAQLRGRVHEAHGGACVVVDRRWEPDRSHGWHAVESYLPDPSSPLALFDPRLADRSDWSSRVVFFDIETTGLSGGAGTVAFVVGCGWFEPDGGFTVRQLFLAGPGGESAQLDLLERIFNEASLVVTFNGRTFDFPVMDMRWAFHRRDAPTADVAHFDMLPPSRRLWGRLDLQEQRPCTLASLERSVLGFHRVDDVPGFEIPTRYFQFLRSGDASVVEGVLEHNRHDIVSLAALMSRVLKMGQEGPSSCRDAGEQVGLGRLYERAGDAAQAMRAYELAAAMPSDRDTRRHALARLAVLMRRDERFEEAAAAWARVLAPDGGPGQRARRVLTALERRAAEALAIHHEHRVRDPKAARQFAALLESRPGRATGMGDDEAVAHRLRRLARKIDAAQQKSGPKAAPLLDET